MKVSRISVGMAVRAARQAARLSLGEISEKTGISVSALSRIENGLPSLDFVEAAYLAEALNVDLEHFRALASTFEEEGLSDQAFQKKEALSALRSIQRLAILAAVEASASDGV